MFTGFSDATADMFWDIRFNNDREWFHTQKARFDQTVMQPVKALSGDLFDWFSAQHPQLHLNLHISRIYRDARRLFGRGPLKDHIWFSFQNEVEGYAEAPCFWFEVGADGYSCGAGWWTPLAAAARLRRLIDNDPKRAEKILKELDAQKELTLTGPCYARPKGHADEAIGRLYNLRSVSVESARPYDALSASPELADWVKAHFASLVPLYQLCEQAYTMAD